MQILGGYYLGELSVHTVAAQVEYEVLFLQFVCDYSLPVERLPLNWLFKTCKVMDGVLVQWEALSRMV